MSGHSNAKGNVSLLKTQFNKNREMGEKALAFEFEMIIKGYENLSVLIRSTQFPAMGRSDVEDFGAYGLKFMQHGALENSGEITVMAAETITGHVLKAIREIVKEKKYVDITIRLTPESTGKAGNGQEFDLLHCKLRSDAVELSTEDTATIVKPSMTITYNWVDL